MTEDIVRLAQQGRLEVALGHVGNALDALPSGHEDTSDLAQVKGLLERLLERAVVPDEDAIREAIENNDGDDLARAFGIDPDVTVARFTVADVLMAASQSITDPTALRRIAVDAASQGSGGRYNEALCADGGWMTSLAIAAETVNAS